MGDDSTTNFLYCKKCLLLVEISFSVLDAKEGVFDVYIGMLDKPINVKEDHAGAEKGGEGGGTAEEDAHGK